MVRPIFIHCLSAQNTIIHRRETSNIYGKIKKRHMVNHGCMSTTEWPLFSYENHMTKSFHLCNCSPSGYITPLFPFFLFLLSPYLYFFILLPPPPNPQILFFSSLFHNFFSHGIKKCSDSFHCTPRRKIR